MSADVIFVLMILLLLLFFDSSREVSELTMMTESIISLLQQLKRGYAIEKIHRQLGRQNAGIMIVDEEWGSLKHVGYQIAGNTLVVVVKIVGVMMLEEILLIFFMPVVRQCLEEDNEVRGGREEREREMGFHH